MIVDNGDREKLAKLGINDLLGLALLTPTRYEDTRLLPQPYENREQAVHATLQSVTTLKGQMRIELFSHNFNLPMMGIIFHPKPFHKGIFRTGSEGYYLGKIERFGGRLQLIQPKRITTPDTIKAVYKTALRNDVLSRLIHKYLTKEALLAQGIPEPIAQRLIEIHTPTLVPENTILHSGGFTKPYLEALKFTEIFRYLKRLLNTKRTFKSPKASSQPPQDFIDSLPFTLTGDQTRAIEAIYQDLQQPIQARRMIIGDVGCGKTMVMLATAYMAHPHKAVIMAPTSLLANQLYEEASKFLSQWMNILLLTQKSPQTTNALAGADLIIGTHALLHTELPNVAVVMVDEQHRFGTKQRHELTKMTSSGDGVPHFFQFSATPIPRTQAMVESTLVDVTFIKELPFPKDITTTVIRKEDFSTLLTHIRDEIKKSHQVLIIYPLVEESESIPYQSLDEAQGFWCSHFEEVYITHGKDKEKEQILLRFREQGHILLATTVVEVGISLPRLTTVVIAGAERLGLATLHQLKGRVSRTGLKGYCYLYTNQKTSARLDAFTETESGFEVAELDLAFRKSGDLLTGSMQSGEQFRFFDHSEDGTLLIQARHALGLGGALEGLL